MGRLPNTSLGLFRGRPIIAYARQPAVRWPEHPLARGGGYVLIARLLLSERLGHVLRPGERVRWRDGNRWNMTPENLEVYYPVLAYRDRRAAAWRRRVAR